MIITTHAFARAGLVGNPSDGYFGKTISFVIRNFKATVRLWESPHFEIAETSLSLGAGGHNVRATPGQNLRFQIDPLPESATFWFSPVGAVSFSCDTSLLRS